MHARVRRVLTTMRHLIEALLPHGREEAHGLLLLHGHLDLGRRCGFGAWNSADGAGGASRQSACEGMALRGQPRGQPATGRLCIPRQQPRPWPTHRRHQLLLVQVPPRSRLARRRGPEIRHRAARQRRECVDEDPIAGVEGAWQRASRETIGRGRIRGGLRGGQRREELTEDLLEGGGTRGWT